MFVCVKLLYVRNGMWQSCVWVYVKFVCVSYYMWEMVLVWGAAGKTRSVLAQTPMSLSAVPMDARTCHFHRTVGYLENGCRKIRISTRMMMVMRRIMIIMILMIIMVIITRDCDGAARWKKNFTKHMVRIPFEGEGGGRGVPFSWSFRDKGSNPPLCFAKWNSK